MAVRASERVQRMWARVGLRARLEAFIILAMLPLIGLILFLVLQERDQEIERARQNMIVLAERGAAQHAEILRQAHSVLRMLNLVPEIRMAASGECMELLQQTSLLNSWSTGFSVVHPDGRLLCDSDGQQLSIADRSYFKQALETGKFTVSNYVIGRASGKPALIAVLPTLSDVGKADRFLLAGVDLKWLAGLAAEVARTTGGVVTLIDGNGTVLARQPDEGQTVGRSVADQPSIKKILSDAGGVIEGAGLDGVQRIIGFASLENTGARLAVAVPRDTIVAAVNQRLLFSTGVLGVVVVFVVIGIWILMEVSVLRGLRNLRVSTAQMSSGYFDPCQTSGFPGALTAEIGEIAHAVQAMGRRLNGFAYQDQLTGLPNRRALDAYVERLGRDMRQQARGVAVLYADLDGFKPVNDQHGHHIGDAVLEEVGARLAKCIRTGDIVARLGGDEFAVIARLPDGSSGHIAGDIAARIIRSIAEPFSAEGKEIRIGCSVGVAIWPADGQDLHQVLQHADHALYAAKHGGRGRAVRYEAAETAADPRA